jgi:hypothetical protein
MRQVMRELLLLLASGQIARSLLLDNDSPLLAQVFSYDDLTVLRPQFAASSWRGMTAKLIAQRMAFRTLQDGKVGIQLTKLGLETVAGWFVGARYAPAADQWLLLVYQVLPEQLAQPTAVRRLVESYGLRVVIPGLAVHLQVKIEQGLLAGLKAMNYQAVYLPVRPADMQPFTLLALSSEDGARLRLARRLAMVSTDIKVLLEQIDKTKKITHQQKQRIGSLLISGLTILQAWQRGPQDTVLEWQSRRDLARSLDNLVAIWRQRTMA